MTRETLLLTNPRLRRKWGWAWSATPAGEDAWIIETPTKPDVVGTLKQVGQHIAEDRTYHSLFSGGTFLSTQWFYGGRRLAASSARELFWEINMNAEDGQPGKGVMLHFAL